MQVSLFLIFASVFACISAKSSQTQLSFSNTTTLPLISRSLSLHESTTSVGKSSNVKDSGSIQSGISVPLGSTTLSSIQSNSVPDHANSDKTSPGLRNNTLGTTRLNSRPSMSTTNLSTRMSHSPVSTPFLGSSSVQASIINGSSADPQNSITRTKSQFEELPSISSGKTTTPSSPLRISSPISRNITMTTTTPLEMATSLKSTGESESVSVSTTPGWEEPEPSISNGTASVIPSASAKRTSSFPGITSTQSSDMSLPIVLSATSTMTTMPTKVSTELVTSSGVTTNTWIKTNKDGESTTVPVIWCPECGGSIVVWNFPEVSGTIFKWPDLPKFEFPCIPLPFKPCHSPPKTTDDGEDKGGDDKDNKSSSSSTKSTTKTTSSQSSESSCSAGTTAVSDCRVACSVSTRATRILERADTTVNGITANPATTTVCFTTSCSTISGCDLQPTTTSTITSDPSAGPSCAFDTATMYNARASYEAMGMPLPIWLQYPLTHVLSTPAPAKGKGKGKGKADPKGEDATGISMDGTATDDIATATDLKSSSASDDHSSFQKHSTTISATALSTSTKSEQTSPTSSMPRKTIMTLSTTPSSSFSASSNISSTLIETSTMTSSSSSSTSSTAPSPSFDSNPTCWQESNFAGHAAIDANFFEKAAGLFCDVFDREQIKKSYRDEKSVNYLFEVQRTEGCTDPPDADDKMRSCQDLITDTYYNCDNGGIGGSITAGCFDFSFTGGLGDDHVPTPEQIPTEETEDPESQVEPEPEPEPEPEADADLTSLSLQPVSCYEGDFKHIDVSPKSVRIGAEYACSLCVEDLDSESRGCGDELGNLLLQVYWIDGCHTTVPSQSPRDPLGNGEQTCESLLRSTFDNCNNGGAAGAAGTVDVGCLRYDLSAI